MNSKERHQNITWCPLLTGIQGVQKLNVNPLTGDRGQLKTDQNINTWS